MSGYATSPFTIYVSWEGPMNAFLLTLVESYLVLVEEIDTGKNWNVTSQENSKTLTSLHPHYSYELSVAAITNDTIQPYSFPIVLTTLQAGLFNAIMYIHTCPSLHSYLHLLLSTLGSSFNSTNEYSGGPYQFKHGQH